MFGCLIKFMIALLQKVNKASVHIDKKLYSSINEGMLIFLGIHTEDTKDDAQYLVQKITQTRIFSDHNNKMNLDIQDTKGSILVVSQFTLYGNLKKGNRPSFIQSADPQIAEFLYNYFLSLLKEYKIKTETGKFGANMKVNLTNDGPVTLIIDTKNG
tara:strand:- start:292 stop:762 length:471 start_codon:yes stop_codon:yes gene_type:complete